MTAAVPTVAVIAGPNGAGKSTTAPLLLQRDLGIREFVNADVIAQGLSGIDPSRAAIAAGRVMLERLNELAASHTSFAFETTLASRTFAPRIAALIGEGYRFSLCFLWLPTAEAAIMRVASRVQAGGHHVPDDDVRRRYGAGLRNFFQLYKPLASDWVLADNSAPCVGPRVIAAQRNNSLAVVNEVVWQSLQQQFEKGDGDA